MYRIVFSAVLAPFLTILSFNISPQLPVNEVNLGYQTEVDRQTEDVAKESESPAPVEYTGEIIENVQIYTQNFDRFYQDNTNYRGNPNLISFGGKYVDFKDIGNIVFVGDTLNADYNIKSGDVINIYNTDYVVIDNKSTCNEYTDYYCIELLTDNTFLSESDITLKKE